MKKLELPRFEAIDPQTCVTDRVVAKVGAVRCYCCRDTGLIRDQIASQLIEDWHRNSVPLICNASQCYSAKRWPVAQLDGRVKSDVCDRIHRHYYELEAAEVKQQYETQKAAIAKGVAEVMSARPIPEPEPEEGELTDWISYSEVPKEMVNG